MSGTSGMSSAQLMVREILTYQQTAQKLRADLATVTAERDAAIENQCAANRQWQSKWDELCAAHAETRKALEQAAHDRDFFDAERQREIATIESTRDALETQLAAVREWKMQAKALLERWCSFALLRDVDNLGVYGDTDRLLTAASPGAGGGM